MDGVTNCTEIVKTAKQIEALLRGRAIVTCNEEQNRITIRPHLRKFCCGSYLELIRDAGWNDIKIMSHVEVELIGWLIDTTDSRIGADLWCLQWMKDNYNIIDTCVRIS